MLTMTIRPFLSTRNKASYMTIDELDIKSDETKPKKEEKYGITNLFISLSLSLSSHVCNLKP